MEKLFLFGAGEIAQLAHFYFTEQGKYEVVGFVVDDEFKKEDRFCGLPVTGISALRETYSPDTTRAFVAMSYASMNQVRERKYLALKNLGYHFVSYVSPRCTALGSEIGENCFILEDNTIQPFVRIGNNVTLWSGNHIGHHSVIEDNCFITSHVVISGGVRVGKNTFIGVNSTLRDHIVIGAENMIGAGCLISKNTAPKEVYRAPRAERLEISSDQLKKM